jgi:hypothetical protein
VFYTFQIKELELEIQHDIPRKFNFCHHFDDSTKEILLPSKDLEFNRIKILEFKAGLAKIVQLRKKAIDNFRKEVSKMVSTAFESPVLQATYLDSLPQHIADAIRQQLNAETRQPASQNEKVNFAKKIGEYSEKKLYDIGLFFSSKLKEAENNAELAFATKRSRAEARSTGQQAQRRMSDQQQALLDLAIGALQGPSDSPLGSNSPIGGVARNAAANVAARAQQQN